MGRLTCDLCTKNQDMVSAPGTNTCSACRELACGQLKACNMWLVGSAQRYVADLKACRGSILSEIRSFLSIFLTSNSFLPTNTHPPNTCSHFRYDLTTCSLPLISFRFHHSHQVRTFANVSEVNSKDLPKTGAIYSRGSSPGTFSHPIPYCKASPIDSLDAHSSMNS